MRLTRSLLLLFLLPLTGCAAPGVRTPTPIANNAVASVRTGDSAPDWYSFGGITDPGDESTITAASFSSLAPVPDLPGPPRIGASAISIGGQVYVAGGYSVSEDGKTETTEPNLYRYDPAARTWEDLGPVPVEVDDTAMGSWGDRWLYLFSGWHGPAHANVRNVQVYDIQSKAWTQAAPIPTPGVFGHVAGIVRTGSGPDSGPVAVVADGVKIVPTEDGRAFVISDSVCTGRIDPEDPTRIEWRAQEPHPGRPTYRAACAQDGDRLLIVNGSSTPYNIDGVGYDGTPARPLDQTLIWTGGGWTVGPAGFASMDHRGLVRTAEGWAVIGGMESPKTATDRVRIVDTLSP